MHLMIKVISERLNILLFFHIEFFGIAEQGVVHRASLWGFFFL